MRKPRHIKNNKKNTWTNLRAELSQLQIQLDIPSEDFSAVGIDEWKQIEARVWSTFSARENAVWIWEHLKLPAASVQIDFKDLKLIDFVDREEVVWFILNDTVNQTSKFWVYEGKVEAFDSILNEMFHIDEIIIVSKKYEWILIFNHHDVLVGTGLMKDRIENYNGSRVKDER